MMQTERIRHSEDASSVVDSIMRPDTPLWILQTMSSMLGLMDLGDNWDSYGSPPPSRDLALAIVELLRYCELDAPAPRVAPMCGGGIQLEWQVGDLELEFSFCPDGRASYLSTRLSGEVLGEEEFHISQFSAARKGLRWLRHST